MTTIVTENKVTTIVTQGIQGPPGAPGPIGNGTWGSITGTLSNQTDLNSALSGKSSTSHTHTGTYEPADATILKNAAIGVSVAAQGHLHTGVYEAANANIQTHIGTTGNPHGVTKSDVGLGNVDNTSDANKPISTLTQTALNGKSDTGHTHSYEPANANIQSHISATGNTHGLTLGDIGAAASGHTHTGVYEPADATILKNAAIGVSVAAYVHNHDGTYATAAHSHTVSSVAASYTAGGTTSIAYAQDAVYYATAATGITTWEITGLPSSGTVASWTIELSNGGQFAQTWFTNTRWDGGTIPTLTSTGTDILTFYTRDAGANIRGFVAAKDSK